MQQTSPLMIDIGQGLSLMIGMPTITSWKTRERPQKAKAGTFGFNSDTKNLEYWDGTSWWQAPMYEE